MKNIVFMLLLLLSPAIVFAGKVTVVVPPQITTNSENIGAYFQHIENMRLTEDIEIKIYFFSSGVEVLTLHNDKFTYREKTGQVKALVKLKTGKVLKQVLFVSAEGSTKEILLKNLAQKIEEALRK